VAVVASSSERLVAVRVALVEEGEVGLLGEGRRGGGLRVRRGVFKRVVEEILVGGHVVRGVISAVGWDGGGGRGGGRVRLERESAVVDVVVRVLSGCRVSKVGERTSSSLGVVVAGGFGVVFEGFDESSSADEGREGFVEVEGGRRVVVMVGGRGRGRGCIFVEMGEGGGGGIGVVVGLMSDVKTCRENQASKQRERKGAEASQSRSRRASDRKQGGLGGFR